MPLVPENENKDSYLPNPMENYSVSEAYSSVFKAVIEASATSVEDSITTHKEIPFCFTIGYASSLMNFSLSFIDEVEKIIDELKQIQVSLASCNQNEYKEKLIDSNIHSKKKIRRLLEIADKRCFNIRIFEKEQQSFSLIVTGKISKKLNFSVPSANVVIVEMQKLNSVESINNINFETLDKEILNFKEALLKEHENIKHAKESVTKDQVAPAIADIDEVKEIIEKLKNTMINKPKLINLNQSNISKNRLINIRKL